MSTATVWGDYDNDGDLDLVVGGPIRAYRNDGGILTDEAVFTLPDTSGITSLVWGDYDRDGDLDLAAGIATKPKRVYRNDAGTLSPEPVWMSTETDSTMALAWGDVNGDGQLDLASANKGQPVRLYLNQGGTLSQSASWSSAQSFQDYTLAWGDSDRDGDLDLVVGGYNQSLRLYRNQAGSLTGDAIWTSTEARWTRGVAWGDYDGDGDLDLAAGNYVFPSAIYRNDGGTLGSSASWLSDEYDTTVAITWADYDADGDVDLVTGVPSGSHLYRNDAGTIPTAPIWQFAESDYVESMAWGDYDGDGDIDLALGNSGQDRLFRNDVGILNPVETWASAEGNRSESVAWGDYDGDGDVDLAVGNLGYPVRLYRNNGGVLSNLAVWSSANSLQTMSIAWGDYDRDGDLDLVVGNSEQQNMLFRNNSGTLTTTPVWSAAQSRDTTSIAWGDYDRDGDLDLAIGNYDEQNQIYRNNGGTLSTSPAWTSSDSDSTTSVAWGDYNGDGYLDLAAGNYGQANKIYRNNSGSPSISATWISTELDSTQVVAWSDLDRDGDQDLVVGNAGQPIRLYRNAGTLLPTTATWSTPDTNWVYDVAWGDYNNDSYPDLAVGRDGYEQVYQNSSGTLASNPTWNSGWSDMTYSVAWGDYDRDGDLDLATGNFDDPDRVFRNTGGTLDVGPTWSSGELTQSEAAAWGDYDSDGDLDLAVGNYGQPNTLYRNDGGALTETPAWWASSKTWTLSIAWGDYDGDGDLDLVAGNNTWVDTLYRNDSGVLTGSSVWSSTEQDVSYAVAWADYDGDGDLDLATGNYGAANRLYLNDGRTLATTATWQSTELDRTMSLAWGDVDGDGDLDLAAGNNGDPIRLYGNEGGTLTTSAIWSAARAEGTYSIVWGDVDGDGDLDLAAGNFYGPTRIYQNDSGTLTASPAWTSMESDGVTDLAWGDYDQDGDLDLATACSIMGPTLYRNDGAGLATKAAWVGEGIYVDAQSAVWGDVDLDGDLDLATGEYSAAERLFGNTGTEIRSIDVPGANIWPVLRLTRPLPPANADGFSSPRIWPASGSSIPINYTLRQPNSHAVAYIRAYYSPDGGGQWLPAIAATGTITTNLATSPTGIDYTYNWDVFASGFFGQSDNVVFRIVAVPDLRPVANSVPGPFLFGSNASSTFPFRVRGTQVRVMANGQPVKDALVYRQPAGDTEPATLITSLAGEPFKTDAQGYLQGRGTINVGDRLLALAPVTATASYTLYHTNAIPTPTGVDGFTVSAPGVQTLAVSAAHPLVLFNLDISLEWDARNDTQFLTQLNYDLQRASEFLFDWTNGQAALGALRIHHRRDFWPDAHIRIYATNRLRPSAAQGGVVSEPYTETLPSKTLVYYPGQLYMGATWNRYGNAGSNLDEDWPRTLAHELGHYVLYLQDNYLGKNAQGQIIPVDGCAGAMADPYRDDAAQGYGEFHATDDWLPACATTLSNLDTGRSDWATIAALYPQLDGVTPNAGPSTLPLAVTQVQYVEPPGPPVTLKAPIYFLAQDGQRVQPGSTARAFLYRGGWATDLGRPTLDQLLARGAEPGDRVCLYEPSAGRLGCEVVTPGDEQLALVSRPDWQPDIRVSPVTSVTLVVNVSNLPAGLSLQAQLYPLDRPAGGPIALIAEGNVYSGTVHLVDALGQPAPAFEGYVQVWVDEAEPRREAVIDYTLGSNPGHQRSGGGHQRSGGGHQRSGGAPVMSADGQVILFAPDVAVAPEWFYTLQATSAGVQPPPWATLVGQAYRLSATANAPSLAGTSLSFSYLGSEVPPGEEEWLKLYHHDGTAWQQLTTSLDKYHNLASAPTQGPGIYALMSSIEVGIEAAGWNFISYPVQVSRPVTEALISITGYYTTVYSYRPTDALDPWKVYDVTVPDWVNDLDTLEFGRGYWINVLQALILRLRGASTATAPQGQEPDQTEGIPLPPATYYGRVLTTSDYVPEAGVPVTAFVEDNVCGWGRTLTIGEEVVYSVNVYADGPGAGAGCGATGRQVRFQVGDLPMATTANWNNERLWEVPLVADPPEALFLPLILAHP